MTDTAYVILPAYSRSRGTTTCRFYRLSEEQDRVRQGAIDIAATIMPEAVARHRIDIGIARLLLGYRGKAKEEPLHVLLRRVFARLTDDQILALPVLGPPDRVTALALPVSTRGVMRLARLDLDEEQADIVNEIIDELVHDGEDRAEAWRFVTLVVGRLVCGAEIKDLEAPFMLRLASLFLSMDASEINALPDASIDDDRTWWAK